MQIGYKQFSFDNNEMDKFYRCPDLFANELEINEYLVIKDKEGTVVDIFYRGVDGLSKRQCYKLDTENDGVIKPRNLEQQLAFDMLSRDNIPIKVLSGVFGSGKEYMMVNFALDKLARGIVNKIVWVRNNIEVQDTVPLGALPGSKVEKLIEFAMPLADHVGGIDQLNMMMDRGQVEVEHLGYLRGRDIRNAIIYCTEAENLTTKQMQLLIGRVGEGSQLWINGDERQADKKIFRTDNGLRSAILGLYGDPLFAHIYLPTTERSAVARLADRLDQFRQV